MVPGSPPGLRIPQVSRAPESSATVMETFKSAETGVRFWDTSVARDLQQSLAWQNPLASPRASFSVMRLEENPFRL